MQHLNDSWKEQLELYALGVLNEKNAGEVREHLVSGCEECGREVSEIQETLSLLPESLPDQSFGIRSKQRVLSRIHDLISEPPAFGAAFDRFDEMHWEELGMPGVRVHWLRKEESSGTTVALLRVSPGSVFTDHKHIGSEDCFVLQGGFEDDHGSHHAGDYIHYPAGSIQRNLRALDGEDCILFLVNHHGIEPV